MEIRQVNDAKLIAKLNEPVQNLHHELYPKKFKKFDYDTVCNYFKGVINNENNRFFVCFIDNEAVGYIWFEEIVKIETPFSYASHFIYINQVSVNESHRGQGVGKHLFNEVLKFAKEESISRIGLDYWIKNTSAKKVYDAFGFELEKEVTYLNL